MKPALTREEWEVEQSFPLSPGDWVEYFYDTPEDLHALAARCLHNQSFGFHREDVANIRDALIFKYREPDDERNEQLESLADRIEALLPPETEGD